jgi:hypothetical protein
MAHDESAQLSEARLCGVRVERAASASCSTATTKRSTGEHHKHTRNPPHRGNSQFSAQKVRDFVISLDSFCVIRRFGLWSARRADSFTGRPTHRTHARTQTHITHTHKHTRTHMHTHTHARTHAPHTQRTGTHNTHNLHTNTQTQHPVAACARHPANLKARAEQCHAGGVVAVQAQRLPHGACNGAQHHRGQAVPATQSVGGASLRNAISEHIQAATTPSSATAYPAEANTRTYTLLLPRFAC